MRRRLGPRFGAEAGLIAAAAAVAALLELDWPGIVAVVFGTWLAIAVFEIAWTRAHAPAAEAPAAGRPAAAVAAPAAPPAAPVATEPAPAPAAAHEPAPEPAPAPAPAVPEPERVQEPVPAAAAPAQQPPAAPPPPPAPAAPQIPLPAPPPVPAGPPRSWNLWELERAARDLAGADVMADEERQYMLLYLRDFASPDGKLPIDFDPLVREAFGGAIAVAS